MSQKIVKPVKVDEMLRFAKLQPWWEIRTPDNVLLISKKLKEGEMVVGRIEHNNDEDLSFEEALFDKMKMCDGLYDFLLIKLGTARNSTNTFQYFAVSLRPEEESSMSMLGFQQVATPGGPAYIMTGGMPQPLAGKAEPAPAPDLTQMLATIESKFEAKYNKMFQEQVMELERKMFRKEVEDFEKKKAELEERERELEEKMRQKQFDWDKALDAAPKVLNGVKGMIDLFKDSQPLAGAHQPQQIDQPKQPSAPKEKTFAFKVKKKEEQVGQTNYSEETHPMPVHTESNRVQVKMEFPDFVGEFSQEEIEALRVMAFSMKEGKLNPEEVKEVARKPEEFFEPEETQNQPEPIINAAKEQENE